jgi:hypothetical protein
MFREQVVKKIEQHILCSIKFLFSENPFVYEIMWKNMLEPDRTYMTIQHSAEEVTKTRTQTHSQNVQINHQPNATIFQFIILMFTYSSTCFGRFPDHHQELNDCSGSLWFYLRIVVIAVLCSWSARQSWPRTQHGYRHDKKSNQRLPLQSLSSWCWAGKSPKHVEL